MIWRIFYAILITAVTVIHAQEEPIYVPFPWNRVPINATAVRTSGPTTTFILLEGRGRRPTPGPATLIQNPSEATMTYVAPTATLSGICNLRSPIAMCTLNVYETGAVFPSAGLPGKSSTAGIGGGSTERPGTALLGSAAAEMGGFVIALVTVVFGFAISVALIR